MSEWGFYREESWWEKHGENVIGLVILIIFVITLVDGELFVAIERILTWLGFLVPHLPLCFG